MSETNGRRPAYVAIARKAFESDPLWLEKRKFSRWEAWEYLIQRASYVDRRWAIPGGPVIQLVRGETPPLSHSYLAQCWGWSVKQVRAFLAWLCRVERIGQSQGTAQGHTYLLVNYERYQGVGHSDGHGEGVPEGSPAAARGQESKTGEAGGVGHQVTDGPDPGPRAPARELRSRRRSRASQGTPAPEDAQSNGNWVSRVAATWRECGGEADPGELGRTLKGVHAAVGDVDRLCYGLARWLLDGNAAYGPRVFARDWRRWLPGGREGIPSVGRLAIEEFVAEVRAQRGGGDATN